MSYSEPRLILASQIEVGDVLVDPFDRRNIGAVESKRLTPSGDVIVYTGTEFHAFAASQAVTIQRDEVKGGITCPSN